MSAAHLAQQIAGASAFFASQEAVLPQAMQVESKAAMATSLSAQIASAPSLSIADAPVINAAIAASAFTDAQKQALAQAVSSRCLAEASDAKVRRKGTQTLREVPAYLTASDWAILGSAEQMQMQKVARVQERLLRLGLTNPAEATVRAVVATIASQHAPMASAKELRGMVLDAKAAAGRKGVHTGLPHLTIYPTRPDELPSEVFAAAYSADDPPQARQVENWQGFLAKVPLRSTNGALEGSTSQSSRGSVAASPPPQMDAGARLQCMMQFFMQHSGAGQSANAARLVQMLPVAAPPPALQALPPSGSSWPALPPAPSPPLPVTPKGRAPLSAASPATQTLAQSVPKAVAFPALAWSPASAWPTPAAAPIEAAKEDAAEEAEETEAKKEAEEEEEEEGEEAEEEKEEEAGGTEVPAKRSGKTLGTNFSRSFSPSFGSAEDLVASLERAAAGNKGSGAGVKKRPAAAGPPAPPPAAKPRTVKAAQKPAEAAQPAAQKPAEAAQPAQAGKAKKRPAAAAPALLLGCPKCRGSPVGCVQCKNPAYGGRRYQR